MDRDRDMDMDRDLTALPLIPSHSIVLSPLASSCLVLHGMLCCTVLCCTLVCCTILCCTVLYCDVLCCTIMYCAVLCTVQSSRISWCLLKLAELASLDYIYILPFIHTCLNLHNEEMNILETHIVCSYAKKNGGKLMRNYVSSGASSTQNWKNACLLQRDDGRTARIWLNAHFTAARQ